MAATEGQEKLAEMCQHMRDLIAHCNATGVRFGGCGECGSAWLTCDACPGIQVDEAHLAFEDREVAG